MNKWLVSVVLVALLANGWIQAAEEQKEHIQLALLLDTSNSMDGLINQAKAKLWRIVNEFALMKKDGRIPELQIALYEYGKSSLPPAERFLRLIVPFTTDLDKISQELFALTTNGGEEFCGAVIKAATESLQWSLANDDYKAIFIAGNEPFTQGDIDYKEACKHAVAKGIIVNTIFCGSFNEGVATQWQHGALLADGGYMNIDQNLVIVEPEAPQDRQIVALGEQLNKTYVAYGAEGLTGKTNQESQDASARETAPSVFADRMVAKSSVHYKAASWDLVDAVKNGVVKLEDIPDADLPAELKNLTTDERKAYLEQKQQEREHLQKEIQTLNAERRRYLDEAAKKSSPSDANTLDSALVETIKTQISKKGFQAE